MKMPLVSSEIDMERRPADKQTGPRSRFFISIALFLVDDSSKRGTRLKKMEILTSSSVSIPKYNRATQGNIGRKRRSFSHRGGAASQETVMSAWLLLCAQSGDNWKTFPH